MDKLTLSQLDKRLSEYGLKVKGSRLLKEFRLGEHENGRPVALNLRIRSKDPPVFTFFPHCTNYDSFGNGSLLRIPRDVIKTKICIFLLKKDVSALFSLMFSCKQFQCVCFNVLYDYAKKFFNTDHATPIALSWYVKRKDCLSIMTRTPVKDELNLSMKEATEEFEFTRNRYYCEAREEEFTMELMKKSIKKNVYFDNVVKLHALRKRHVVGKIAEKEFIKSKIDDRIKEINDTLLIIGYGKELLYIVKKSIEKEDIKEEKTKSHVICIENERTKKILLLFSNISFLDNVNTFVIMKNGFTACHALSTLMANRGPLILKCALECDVDKIEFTEPIIQSLTSLVGSFNLDKPYFSDGSLSQVFRHPILKERWYGSYKSLYCMWIYKNDEKKHLLTEALIFSDLQFKEWCVNTSFSYLHTRIMPEYTYVNHFLIDRIDADGDVEPLNKKIKN